MWHFIYLKIHLDIYYLASSAHMGGPKSNVEKETYLLETVESKQRNKTKS